MEKCQDLSSGEPASSIDLAKEPEAESQKEKPNHDSPGDKVPQRMRRHEDAKGPIGPDAHADEDIILDDDC